MRTLPLYQSPYIYVCSIEPEGIICASGGNEGVGENPGSDWDIVELLD